MAEPLTLHHQVVINLVGFVACADWRAPDAAMARAEIAARVPLAGLTGCREVDRVLRAAAEIGAGGPDSILRACDAFRDFLFWRAGQAQAAADAQPGGETDAG